MEVPPVEINGKRYVVNHWGHQYSQRQNGGFIEIWDIDENILIEVVRVYKIFYFPLLERDVQDVFITDLSVSEDNKYLIIKTEDDRIYHLDLDTNRIVKF